MFFKGDIGRMRTWKILSIAFSCGVLSLWICGLALANQGPQVATVDAGIGPCRADFTVKDGSDKPIYNSKIDVSIKYGFMNKRESDLEAYTNSDGQARFTGLPSFPKKPLQFTVASGTVSKTVTDDPSGACNAVFNVTLAVR
jgi:hypothetical protein